MMYISIVPKTEFLSNGYLPLFSSNLYWIFPYLKMYKSYKNTEKYQYFTKTHQMTHETSELKYKMLENSKK